MISFHEIMFAAVDNTKTSPMLLMKNKIGTGAKFNRNPVELVGAAT